MSDKRILTCGAQCGAGATGAVARKPRAVIVGNSVFAGNAADQFRKLGWDVFHVAADDDLAAAVLAKKPNAVLLPAETGTESGHLIAAKLRKAKPKMKVVLIAAARSAWAERFAKFVGATFAVESDGASKVVAAVVG
jgi:hypothetical protein